MGRYLLLINEFALLRMASDNDIYGEGSVAPCMSIHVLSQLAPGWLWISWINNWPNKLCNKVEFSDNHIASVCQLHDRSNDRCHQNVHQHIWYHHIAAQLRNIHLKSLDAEISSHCHFYFEICHIRIAEVVVKPAWNLRNHRHIHWLVFNLIHFHFQGYNYHHLWVLVRATVN